MNMEKYKDKFPVPFIISELAIMLSLYNALSFPNISLFVS